MRIHMLRKIFLLSVLSLFTLAEARTKDMFAEEKAENLKYNTTIRSFMKDNERITKLVYGAYAHAVFPTVGKGSAIFGYASGEGRTYYRGGIWNGNVSVSQYSFGVQVGGSAYSQIIFFKTRDAFERFKLGHIEDSTQSSLVPFYSGISGDVNFDKDVEVYTSMKGGFMLEASTGTQVFKFTPKP